MPDPNGANFTRTEFPSAADYITAIENSHTCVLDPVLRDGRPIRGSDGELLLYSGGFAKVFVVQSYGTTYAVRCWTSDIGNAATRYRAVDRYLKQIRSNYFVNFEYVERGIRWAGVTYPIVRMEWAGGTSLKDFVGAHLDRPTVLIALAESFLSMASSLHSHQIAHGDLQSDNLRILGDGTASPRLLLIDYDTVVVPELLTAPVTNVGVPGFQHPTRGRATNATARVDYFGELVIYLTLYALAQEPRLWHEYRVEEREKELLFTGDDFRESMPSPLFEKLRQLSDGVGDLTRVLWNSCRCERPEDLIPVEEAAALCGIGNRSRPSFSRLLEQKKLGGWLQDWTSTATAGQTVQFPAPAVRSPPVVVIENGVPTGSQPKPSFDRLLQNAIQPAPLPAPSDDRPTPSGFNGVWAVIAVVMVLSLMVVFALYSR